MRNVVLDVVLDCTFGIIGVDVAQCVVIGVIGRHCPHVTTSPRDKGVNVVTSGTITLLDGCNDSEPGGLVVAMTGVDDNDSRLFVGEPRPGIFGIGILTNGVIDTVFIGVYVVLADVTGVCRVGEIRE